MVLRVHGMDEAGVRFSVGPQFGGKSILVDRAGFEPATSTLQMWRSTN